MMRRRERIEKWRAEKKKKEMETVLGKETEVSKKKTRKNLFADTTVNIILGRIKGERS